MKSRFQWIVAAAGLALGAGVQAAPILGSGSLGGSFLALSSANVSGGAIYAQGDNFPSTAARPENSSPSILTSGNWLAAGPSNGNNGGGDAVLTLGAGTTGVSFLWGSPDSYNSFLVTTSAGSTWYSGSSVASALGIALGGNQGHASYLNFTTSGGETIAQIAFQSPNSNAIEISNISAVPEPSSYALALGGLGLLGVVLRRRRQA